VFDWRRFVDLADVLRTTNDEAAQRTAISRAYFAVYPVATEKMRLTSIVQPRGHRIWEQVIDIGTTDGRPDFVVIGEAGLDLKRRREQADYHSPFNRDNRRQIPIDEVTRDTLVAARDLLALLDAL